MNLIQIEAFVKIANNNSFSRTAKELFLTQPTVSAYITSLEEELGVPLFERTTKTVELTENGKKIYTYAEEMVRLARRIQEAVRDTASDAGDRTLTIVSSSIPAQHLLPRIVAEYSRRYPLTRFRVIETDSEGVIEDISEYKADLGFAGTLSNRAHCDFIPFFRDELILVTLNTPKYQKLREEETSLDWIRSEGFVLREAGSGTRQEAVRHFRGLKLEAEDMKVAATFSNTDAVLMSVQEGIGIAVTSRLAAQDRIDRGVLLSFPLSKKGMFRNLYMVTNPIRRTPEPVRRMIELVNSLYGA